jgi:phosphonate transport system substrate-binding protein
VLPVFFGVKPACIVDRLAFETMMEMNPQVGSQLVKVVVSEPYLDSITFMTRHGYVSERARRDLINALAELHQEPAGRQILTLFKVDQLVPFKEEYMKSVKDLRTKQARLKESQISQRSAASLAGTAPRAQPMKEGSKP